MIASFLQYGEYLERIWLLLAERLDATNAGEEVSQLIFQCLEMNRFGYLVNMYDGGFSSQEFKTGSQNYPKAADSFRKAFESCGSLDFASGERYAKALLSANRPMDAIEVLEKLSTLVDDKSGPMWKRVEIMRQQAVQQLSLGKSEKDSKPEAAARRLSRIWLFFTLRKFF